MIGNSRSDILFYVLTKRYSLWKASVTVTVTHASKSAHVPNQKGDINPPVSAHGNVERVTQKRKDVDRVAERTSVVRR